jgi:hypothetical protein
VADRSDRHRADGTAKRIARRAGKALLALLALALVLLSAGSAIGRWRVIPVPSAGADSNVARGSLAMLVPVPAVSLEAGDHVYVRPEHGDRGTVFRVKEVRDSWQRELTVVGADGRDSSMEFPATAWRVSRSVPRLGTPFGLLVGPVQAVFLVVVGVLLVAGSGSRRQPEPHRRNRRAAVAAAS